MTGLKFQPYGVLPGEYKEKGLDETIVMEAWRPTLPQDQRVATFNAWRQERLVEFADALWPCFDFDKRQWVGQSIDFCEDLTEFEIDVMIDTFMGSNHILETKPSSPLSVSDIEKQQNHYDYEDKSPHPPGVNYRQYDRTISIVEERELLETMLRAITTNNWVGMKAAGHFWFKFHMQRPRPLHAAMVSLREGEFVSQLSERGQHPSIVSGHCFQGIMMACAVLENWMKSNPNLNQDRVECLAQYMVDVGDRRVFAGVHYPTDNIASWVLAISLIPEVFEDDQPIVDFVRKAVTTRSLVFQAIQKRFTHSDTQRYTQAALELLAKYELPVQSPASS